MAGQNDEAFYADRFAGVFKTAGKDVPVTILPGIDHISLTLDSIALQAVVTTVEDMDREKPNHVLHRSEASERFFVPHMLDFTTLRR